MCMGKPVDVPGRSPWELKEVWRLAWEPLVLLSTGILSSDLGEPLHLLKCESWSCWGLDLVLLLNGISFDGDTCSLSIIMKVKVTQSCPPLRLHRLYSPWNSSGQNTGVGILSLLQGIFPTQGSNLGLPHCGQILYQLSHQGSPRILDWVAYPFPRGSSQPRNWTEVSCIAGGFFTSWATWEAQSKVLP